MAEFNLLLYSIDNNDNNNNKDIHISTLKYLVISSNCKLPYISGKISDIGRILFLP